MLAIERLSAHHRLCIAGARFSVYGSGKTRLRIVHPLYRSFLERTAAGSSRLEIIMNVVPGGVPALAGMEKVYDTGESWSMFRDGHHFWIALHPPQHARPFWAARFDRRANRVDYYCEAPGPASKKTVVAVPHPVCYPLDQILLMHFLARRKGILTHAAGIVRGGRAFIFPGASGAGKSTFSELLVKARIGKVLSDERMIVRQADGAVQAFGTPWAGTAGIARNGSAPLGGMFFLRHDRENRMDKLGPAETLDRLLPVVSVPWYDPETAAPIVAFAKRLVSKVPAYEMSFVPDRSAVDFFWKFLKAVSLLN